ncbi:MAG: pilus assembly protein PilM [Phycisphaerales bacterium]
MSVFSNFMERPIGLDIGSRLIKAAQLGRKRGHSVVTATAIIGRSHPDTPIDRDEALRLSRVLSQQGFTGRSIVLAAPGERVMSSVIDMPPRESGAPYDVIAAQEFMRLQRQEPGRFELAWWDIPKPARASTAKVMAVGCAHADSNPILDVFASCGFDVVAMDLGLAAAVRASRDVIGTTAGVSAVLDMGWSSARLALVHGGVVVFERQLTNSGLSVLHDRVSKSLGVDPTEAEALIQGVGMPEQVPAHSADDARFQAVTPLLRPILVAYLDDIVKDLVASFEYAAHQYPDAPAHRLILIGGGGCIPGVAGYLDGKVAVAVVPTAAPQAMNHHGSQHGTEAALLTGTLGLAGYHGQG